MEKTNKANNSKYYDGISFEFKNIYIKDVLVEEKVNDEKDDNIKDTVEYNIFIQVKGKDVKIAKIDGEGNLIPNREILQDENNKGLTKIIDILELEKNKVDIESFKKKLKEPKTMEQIKEERKQKNKESNNEKENKDKKTEDIEKNNKEKEESQEQKKIAERKNLRLKDVFVIRKDSQFFKNHPELKEEQGLYFYRDHDGKIKAEYFDKNGNPQPSKFFNNSTTHLKEEVVSLGNGEEAKKLKPYQVMTTNNLHKSQGTMDIRVAININQGYLDIEETRQGTNGKWTGYEIEAKGRDYNSSEVNKLSNMKTNEYNPNNVTDSFNKVENTDLARDGIQLHELSYEAMLQKFIDEGYTKREAIDIYDRMSEPRFLTEEAAKKEVNKEIEKREKNQERDDDVLIPGPRRRH